MSWCRGGVQAKLAVADNQRRRRPKRSSCYRCRRRRRSTTMTTLLLTTRLRLTAAGGPPADHRRLRWGPDWGGWLGRSRPDRSPSPPSTSSRRSAPRSGRKHNLCISWSKKPYLPTRLPLLVVRKRTFFPEHQGNVCSILLAPSIYIHIMYVHTYIHTYIHMYLLHNWPNKYIEKLWGISNCPTEKKSPPPS